MARVSGSKNGKIIRASFKGQGKSFFPTLKQTKVLVLLSVIGNEFCTGEYLKSIIQSATHSHEFTTFLIADEVYWHNLRRDFSQEEELVLKRKALELGCCYLEKNLDYFLLPLEVSRDDFDREHGNQSIEKKISILNGMAREKSNFEVLFWKDWLSKYEGYHEVEKPLKDLFVTEKNLKKSVDQMADNFARRHKCDEKPYDILVKRSCEYLIEETPAVVWAGAKLGYNFIAYPGEMIKPFRAAKEFFIKEEESPAASEYDIFVEDPKKLVNWLEITFQRSHEKKSTSKALSVNQQSYPERERRESYLLTSDMLKGITQGIFGLELIPEEKVKYLVDVIEEFQSRNKGKLSCSTPFDESASQRLSEHTYIE